MNVDTIQHQRPLRSCSHSLAWGTPLDDSYPAGKEQAPQICTARYVIVHSPFTECTNLRVVPTGNVMDRPFGNRSCY